MTRIVFLDTETTGLDDRLHEPWEIAIIVRVPEHPDVEYAWQLPVDLVHADPNGLRVGRYYARAHPNGSSTLGGKALCTHRNDGQPCNAWPTDVQRLADFLAHMLDGAHIVGAVPDFDFRMLRAWLGRHGHAWTAHYHLIDVETLAVGWLAANRELVDFDGYPLPWDSDELTRGLGLEPPSADERHTALGDARWARAIYDRVMNPGTAADEPISAPRGGIDYVAASAFGRLNAHPNALEPTPYDAGPPLPSGSTVIDAHGHPGIDLPTGSPQHVHITRDGITPQQPTDPARMPTKDELRADRAAGFDDSDTEAGGPQ